MFWKELFEKHIEKLDNEAVVRFSDCVLSNNEINAFKNIEKSENFDEIKVFFLNDKHKIFLKALVNTTSFVPNCFIKSMVRHAVYCENPSYNKNYITEPFKNDSKLVFNELLNYIKCGNTLEITGAYQVLYWFDCFNDDNTKSSFYAILPEDKQTLIDYRLKYFAYSDNLNLLKATVHFVNFMKDEFSKEYQGLYDKAYEKAKNHKDEYIRNRYELALGMTINLKRI